LRIRRRSLRKLLIAVGCVVATIEFPSAMVGGWFVFVGSGVHFWSKGTLEQNRRLTTAGPYRWTRNPFYLANLLIDLGLCLVIGRFWVALVFLPIWIYAYHETIAREEQRLLSLFPNEFPRYRETVPRLLPTGRRLDAAQACGAFSLSNDALTKGGEYGRLFGIWLAPAVIWAAAILRWERLAIFEAPRAMTLAVLLLIPVAWVFKLGLAESFRRPQTALLPFEGQPLIRQCTALVLIGAATFVGQPWAWNGPLLWVGLMVLDRSSRSRLDREVRGATRALWRYFPSIAAGGLLISVCVAMMIHRTISG
jgi:hypothetical protein